MENRSRSPSANAKIDEASSPTTPLMANSVSSKNGISSKNTTTSTSTSTPSNTSTKNNNTPDRPMNQLLNNMGNRIMTKPKYGGFCINFQQRLRNSSRYLIILGIIVFFAYFSIYFVELSPRTVPVMSKDRGTDYNVKVLPASLSDEELDKLPKETFSYLTMIDAGSSGCRAHICRYGKLGSVDGPLYIVPQHKSMKVKPGLSSFANNPTDAGPSLKGLVEFMKEQVPEKDWKVTPIWLKATAGLRMLPTSTSDSILDSVRSYLGDSNNSPFLFRSTWAKVIPGNEEGGFGWIAFNYLKKVIGPKRAENPADRPLPYAVIEMGGASAQVSQLAPDKTEAQKIPHDYRFSFSIEGEEYDLYTHSYLGFGAEQAKEQYQRILQQQQQKVSKDPCKHEGVPKRRLLLHSHSHAHSLLTRRLQGAGEGNSTSTGGGASPVSPPVAPSASSSNTSSSSSSSSTGSIREERVDKGLSCPRLVAALFNSPVSPAASASASSTEKCTIAGPHSFGCVYQPDFVAKSANILTFENFYYMASALGVKPVKAATKDGSSAPSFPLETTPSLIKEASEEFCGLPWKEVQEHYPKDSQPKDVNQKSCFISGFAYSFLVDGLKIAPDKVITIQKEVGPSEIEWALGAAYKETADLLKRTHLRPT